jgi:hypothetical protein
MAGGSSNASSAALNLPARFETVRLRTSSRVEIERAICFSRDGTLCASRPLRYVSVINDNHLVSLMNFNAAKVN